MGKTLQQLWAVQARDWGKYYPEFLRVPLEPADLHFCAAFVPEPA